MGLLEDFIRRSDATLLSSDNLLFKSIICVGTIPQKSRNMTGLNRSFDKTNAEKQERQLSYLFRQFQLPIYC